MDIQKSIEERDSAGACVGFQKSLCFNSLKRNNVLVKQSGNVLFVVLIAVILFAALSYAVTLTSRSGGADTTSERSRIDTAVLMQYMTAVRTEALRIMFRHGEIPQLFDMRYPWSSGDLCYDYPERCVFSKVPFYSKDQLNSQLNLEIDYSDGSSGGMTHATQRTDGQTYGLLIFRGVSRDACEQVNEEIGVTSLKTVSNEWDFDLHTFTAEELSIPIQCINSTSDGRYHLVAQAYETDTV